MACTGTRALVSKDVGAIEAAPASTVGKGKAGETRLKDPKGAVCLDPKGALRWSLVLKARCLLIKSEGDRAGPGRSGGASSSQFPAFRVVARPSGPLSPLWPLRVRDQSARFVLLTINAGAVDRTGAVVRTIASSLTPDDPGVASLAAAAHLATSPSLPNDVALVPAAACYPVPLAPVAAAVSHFATAAVAADDVARATQQLWSARESVRGERAWRACVESVRGRRGHRGRRG